MPFPSSSSMVIKSLPIGLLFLRSYLTQVSFHLLASQLTSIYFGFVIGYESITRLKPHSTCNFQVRDGQTYVTRETSRREDIVWNSKDGLTYADWIAAKSSASRTSAHSFRQGLCFLIITIISIISRGETFLIFATARVSSHRDDALVLPQRA